MSRHDRDHRLLMKALGSYVGAAVEHSRSRDVLEHRITSRLHAWAGAAA